jgi:hypothetical protein
MCKKKQARKYWTLEKINKRNGFQRRHGKKHKQGNL